MSTLQKIDLNKYSQFVEAVTSKESNLPYAFNERFEQLSNYQEDNTKINPALLLTAGIGLASETGEFNEIIKKMFFQGKPLNEENRFHMKRELGDIMWYWVNACRALGYDPNDVIDENVRKLEARYPGGKFDAHYSENRKEGDL
jgi:NTP pyrophosphatase (non-canonical NTP hydrolase)